MSRKDRGRNRSRLIYRRIENVRGPDRRSWPIVRAYVPLKDAWRVSGCGTAGIIRRQPDGGLTYSMFNLELTEGGLTGAFGAENKCLEEIEAELGDMAELMPPFEEGEADLTARYVWGAYAMSVEEGSEWPAELKTRHLGMLPPLAGTRNWWLEQFVRELMPAKLYLFAMQVLDAEEVPAHKEPAVAVWMEFHFADSDRLLEICRCRRDDFRETEEFVGVSNFLWIMPRKYPPYDRVPHFLIGIGGGKVLAQAPNLSMASRLVMELRKLAGEEIKLQYVDWGDASELRIVPPGMAVSRSQ